DYMMIVLGWQISTWWSHATLPPLVLADGIEGVNVLPAGQTRWVRPCLVAQLGSRGAGLTMAVALVVGWLVHPWCDLVGRPESCHVFLLGLGCGAHLGYDPQHLR